MSKTGETQRLLPSPSAPSLKWIPFQHSVNVFEAMPKSDIRGAWDESVNRNVAIHQRLLDKLIEPCRAQARLLTRCVSLLRFAPIACRYAPPLYGLKALENVAERALTR